MSNQSIRQATLDQIRDDIRRVAPGAQETTLPVALSNWEHFFQLGQYREAARWWSLAHERIAQGVK